MKRLVLLFYGIVYCTYFCSSKPVYADNIHPPTIRHLPQASVLRGETFSFEINTEGEGGIDRVYLWFRAMGTQTYEKSQMQEIAKDQYKGHLHVTKDFNRGIEYYLEAIDRVGSTGYDGTQKTPYFVAVVRPQKPLYKKGLFWSIAFTVGSVLYVLYHINQPVEPVIK